MPPAQPQSQQGDNSLGPFWVIVGIFALLWAIWHFGHFYIAFAMIHLRLGEVALINLFTDKVANLGDQIKLLDPITVNFSTLVAMSSRVGDYLKYPFAGCLFVLAVAIYFSKPTTKFRKNYSMNMLAEAEHRVWPHITPVIKLDLVSEDISKGVWAMALTPMQFAKQYRLLQEQKVLAGDPGALQRAKTVASLRRDEAFRIFALQVGPYWRGIEHLSPPTKALFAAFAARVGRDQAGSRALLMQISASSETGHLNYSGVDRLLAKHIGHKSVQQVMAKHAFVLTVMASLLEVARLDGVLATAEFLWLKPVDRNLWFMLNTVGRQTPFVEIAGPYAHWLAEKEIQRKIMVPMVEEAVNGLEKAINEVVYKPDVEE